MCQQAVTFCSGSAKPLLFVGSVLTLLLALAIGYTGVISNCLYKDLDSQLANNKSHIYYAQLLTACYLALLALFVALTAHFNQKQSIRVLAILASINFVLVAAAILIVPTHDEMRPLENRLEQAQMVYDRAEQPVAPASNQTLASRAELPRATETQPRQARALGEQEDVRDEPLNKSEATRIWDSLQSRGCCGLKNATTEWMLNGQHRMPKSCCSSPVKLNEFYICEKVDSYHDRACLDILQAPNLNLTIVLALIALVNLFLATVSGVSTYRTFHYSEASQNAYA